MNQVRILSMALIVTLGVMGTWVWKTKQQQWQAEQSIAEMQQTFATDLANKQKEFSEELSNKELEYQSRLAEQNVAFEKRFEEQKQAEKQRQALAMSQFSKIIEGSKSTGDFVNTLEAKVKAGNKISQAETEQLHVLVSAFTHLQKQYQRPLREFSELQQYLERQSDVDLTTPKMKNAFWKRMFSKEFRAQEREFYRSEGERHAYQEAGKKFEEAYGRAQRQMAAVQKDLESATARLNKITQDKQAPEDLTPLFQQLRKGLQIHQQVIEFEPDIPGELHEGVRP